MRHRVVVTLTVVASVLASVVCAAQAERTLLVPEGARVVRVGVDGWKLVLPDRTVVVLHRYNAATGQAAVIEVSRAGRTTGGDRVRLMAVSSSSPRPQLKKRPGGPDTSATHGSGAPTLPLTVSFREQEGEDLASAFLALGIDDPAKSPENDQTLAGLAKEMREIQLCHARGGTWNPQTKQCEEP